MAVKKNLANTPLPPAVVRDFCDLFGFTAVVETFAGLIQSDRLPQVLLFEGRTGIGKRILLAQLAAVIYCHERRGCGTCPGCLQVIHGHEADLLWIETSGPLKVAEAEAVQEHLAYQASGLSYRVVAIVDAEEMTDQAANRLLKIFEEPPPRSLILLSSSQAQQLLPTISSRLVRWRLQPPALVSSCQWLMAKAASEGLTLSEKMARSYLERCSLAPGQAWQMLRRSQPSEAEATLRLDALLLGSLSGGDSQELQEQLKRQGWKANELAQHVELLLNRYYKASLGISSDEQTPLPGHTESLDPRNIRQRRRILQQIYRAGSHNNLNVQLAAEALVLAQPL